MPGIEGQIPQSLQRTLTSLAVDLYWGEEDYYDAREVVSERAVDAGFEFVGVSDNRLVIKIPENRLPDYDEPLAAKLPQRRSYYPGGIKQNVEEIDLYRNGPDWLQEYLIPIEAAHSRAFWLVMRYAPEPDSDAIEERKQELLEYGIVTNEILSAQNWGEWQGEVFLTDYGLYVSDCLEDVEVRNYVDIVDDEDRRRGLIPDDTTEESEETEVEEEERPDVHPAKRMDVSADVIPDMKSDVREELQGKVVESRYVIEVEVDNHKITVEIERTEPRSDRYMQDRELLINDETRISL